MESERAEDTSSETSHGLTAAWSQKVTVRNFVHKFKAKHSLTLVIVLLVFSCEHVMLLCKCTLSRYTFQFRMRALARPLLNSAQSSRTQKIVRWMLLQMLVFLSLLFCLCLGTVVSAAGLQSFEALPFELSRGRRTQARSFTQRGLRSYETYTLHFKGSLAKMTFHNFRAVCADALTGVMHDSLQTQSSLHIPAAVWRELPASLQRSLKCLRMRNGGDNLSEECAEVSQASKPDEMAEAGGVPSRGSEERVSTSLLMRTIGHCLQDACVAAADATEAMRLPSDPRQRSDHRSAPPTKAPQGAGEEQRQQHPSDSASVTHTAGDAVQAWVHNSSVEGELLALLARLEAGAADLRGLAGLLEASQ